MRKPIISDMKDNLLEMVTILSLVHLSVEESCNVSRVILSNEAVKGSY